MSKRKVTQGDWTETLEEAKKQYGQYLYVGEIRELTVDRKELAERRPSAPAGGFRVK